MLRYILTICIGLYSAILSAQELQNTRRDTLDGELVFEFAQELPKPKFNLQEFFSKNVRYPESAWEAGAQGTIFVSAIVTKEGNLRNVLLGKGLENGGAGLNEEAVRVVKLIPDGSFYPGNNNGKAINVRIDIPVRFEISR